MNKTEKKITIISFSLFSMAIIFILLYMGLTTNKVDNNTNDSFLYGEMIFDDSYVHNIDLEVDENLWEEMLDNALNEEYINCDVYIDGELISSVGIRPKGNSSLTNVYMDDTTDRFSYKIKFDEYIGGQSYYGLNALILNNSYSDKSYMKEYLSYELFDELGVPVPQISYVEINLNGENLGLYLAIEPMEESYLLENFDSLDGNLYKPEVGDMAERFTETVSAPIDRTTSNTNLSFIDDNPSSYSYLFDNLVSGEATPSAERDLMEFLEAIHTGEDVDQIMEVESILKYTAVTVFTSNFDSYLRGNRANNYYLYLSDGLVSILPWDLNLAFGGMAMTDGTEAINFSATEPYVNAKEESPLIATLFENEDYYQLYISYLEELASFFTTGQFSELVFSTDIMINSYVAKDSTAFFGYESYLQSLPSLITFAEDRTEAVVNQITGDTELVETSFMLEDLSNSKQGNVATSPEENTTTQNNTTVPENTKGQSNVDDTKMQPNVDGAKIPASGKGDAIMNEPGAAVGGKGDAMMNDTGAVAGGEKVGMTQNEISVPDNNTDNTTLLYLCVSFFTLISALIYSLCFKRKRFYK